MARVFLSYRKADRELTSKIAEYLEAAGHEVWWDTDLLAGDSFRSVIEQELNAADVVIAIWTPNSTTARWVISEAQHGMRLNKLLPLRTDDVRDWQIPKPFDTLHIQLISDRGSILKAVEHITTRKNSDSELNQHDSSAQVSLLKGGNHFVSAFIRIRTLLITIALFMMGGTVASAFWPELDVSKQVLAAGTVVISATVIGCYWLCGNTRNPVYNTILTSNVANIIVDFWFIIGAFARYYENVRDYQVTVIFGLVVSSIYGTLLVAQLRGASWVYPAATIVACSQLIFLLLFVNDQLSFEDWDIWFTTMHEAYLHVLYVAVGSSGVIIASGFLVFNYLYTKKLALNTGT